MNDLQRLDNIRHDRIDTLRKSEDVIGALLSDLVSYLQSGDFNRSATVAAYLFFEIAKRQARAPFTILRGIKR